MKLEELIKICTSEKKTISLVGAGGKTTLMYRLATEAAKQGKKVIVSTTTHIMRPDTNYATDIDAVRILWKNGKYAVIGVMDRNDPQKLTFPEKNLYERVKEEVDIILLEADGAKRFPCKVPADYEPVIEDSELVIGVMGMSALGLTLKEGCFRFAKEGAWLGVDEDMIMNEDIAAMILSSDKGTKKDVNDAEYIVVLNQCDDEDITRRAQIIADKLKDNYNINAVCCCLK